MSYVWSTVEEVTEVLQKSFPGSIVEDMIGYWDVTTQLVDYSIVDSYKLQNGKLVHFATVEMED